MHRKLLIGIMFFLFLAVIETAEADPVLVIEPALQLDPPGEITLEVCETMELKWVIENILHPEVYYVTLTAAIQNNTLLEIITAPHYNATYQVYYPNGSLLSSGTVQGILTIEQFAHWDSTGLKLFEMVTWRLPDSVVLPGDGGYIDFSFQIHCEGIGTTEIMLFARATEDYGEPMTDPANLWLDEGKWYPLHNSYDPWDSDINSGHSFYFYWWRYPTTTAFAKASYTVIQVPPSLFPSIDVEKKGPTIAHEGDEITYTITVNNTGNCDLYNVSVHDTLLGDLAGYLPDTTLKVNELNIFNVTYTVPTPQVSDVKNTVTVSGEDELGTLVSDSDLWIVGILHPNIVVDKTGPQFAHEGDTITYDINVTNTGDCTLYKVNITDTLLGEIAADLTLTPGQSWVVDKSHIVPSGIDPLDNTVSAEGNDNLGLRVSASASWSVDVIHPKIAIEKTGPDFAHEGDTITYWYQITNLGDCNLSDVTVNDDLAGSAMYVSGDANLDNKLNPSETWIFNASYTVSSDEADPLFNNATAISTDQLGLTVTAQDSWTVDILHPAIQVTKEADRTQVHVGETIIYTITVINIGDCPLYDILIEDLILGWSETIAGPFFASQSWSVEHVVTSTDPDPYENTVITEGYDILDMKVDYSDLESVDVIYSAIEGVKSGPALTHELEEITYTINVTNTGEDTLYGVNVTDSLLGTIATDETLAPGETKTFTRNYMVPEGAPDPLVNIVEAEGRDELGATVTDTDTWSVDILHPEIAVVKYGPDYAHEGDLITYEINVTNTGDCDLSVTVSDSILGPNLWTGTLPSGEFYTFTIDYTVPSPSEDVTNTVTAIGVDALGGPDGTITATYSHIVDVLHPSIDVIKTANATEIHYCDWVEYNVTVVNTGDCSLSVVLTDAMLSIDWSGTLAPGDKHEEIVVFHPEEESTINTASAVGTDQLGGTVEDSDSWLVSILRPCIDVEKTGPTSAYKGDTITYTITVSNIGNCPLYNVTITDTLLGDLTGYLPDNILDVDEVNTFEVTYVVPSCITEPVVNTVTAEGTDQLGLTVTDSASWTVDIVPPETHPEIQICKRAWPYIIKPGWRVTYKYAVTNTGDCVLYNVEITDDKLGFIKRIGTLDVGETVTVELSVELFETTKNIGTVTGEDQFGQEVSDSDDALVYVKVTYCAHTIGYWKTHPCAWVDISPWEEFPWTTGQVDHCTYMQILWTPPRGDASIQLARQYIAAVLNMYKYGVPQSIRETITATEAFFQDYPAGSDPQGDARTLAVELASILEDYNSSGICPICHDDDAYMNHLIWILELVPSSITIAAINIRKKQRQASRLKHQT